MKAAILGFVIVLIYLYAVEAFFNKYPQQSQPNVYVIRDRNNGRPNKPSWPRPGQGNNNNNCYNNCKPNNIKVCGRVQPANATATNATCKAFRNDCERKCDRTLGLYLVPRFQCGDAPIGRNITCKKLSGN